MRVCGVRLADIESRTSGMGVEMLFFMVYVSFPNTPG